MNGEERAEGAPLLITGARVNRVDEEGEVELFCYSLQRNFSFRVDPNDAQRWGSQLGKALVVTIRNVEDEDGLDDLYECPECSAKPGCAALCRTCLVRRERAGRLWRGQRPVQAKPEDSG